LLCFARLWVGRSLQPSCMVARHGELGPRLFLPWTRSCRPVVFAVSPGLGFRTAVSLGRSTQPINSINCRCNSRCNNRSLLSLQLLVVVSYEATLFSARAASDLATCRASHIRHPSEMHAASRTSVPSRSFTGHPGLYDVFPSGATRPVRSDFLFLTRLSHCFDHVKTPGSLNLRVIGCRRHPLGIGDSHEHRGDGRISLTLAQWRYAFRGAGMVLQLVHTYRKRFVASMASIDHWTHTIELAKCMDRTPAKLPFLPARQEAQPQTIPFSYRQFGTYC
jgi:hypothetical protein